MGEGKCAADIVVFLFFAGGGRGREGKGRRQQTAQDTAGHNQTENEEDCVVRDWEARRSGHTHTHSPQIEREWTREREGDTHHP